MSYFLLAIPSVLIGYMVFLNIYRYKLPAFDVLAAGLLSYAAMVVSAYLPVFALSADIQGNVVLTACLLILVYGKTKNAKLSGYYALLSMITTMIGSTVVSVLLDKAFGMTIENIRSG